MKKWIALLLSAAIMLSLAGCVKSTGQAPTQGTSTGDVSTADTEMPPVKPAETEDTSADEQKEEQAPAEDNSGAEQLPTTPPDEGIPAPQPSNGQEQEPSAPPPSTPVSGIEPAPTQTAPELETPRILIAYFTWADNTVVEDPSAVDVDATTSASVLAPGNAAKIAGWIQQEVGGDLFSIVVTEPYSSDYDECLNRAADEKADNARPALVNHVDNMEDYDTVFIGFPNWWYTLPMAVLSFVDEYDFSGKTIVPFCTHGTGGLSSTIRDLTAALPDDVTILDPIGVYRPDVDSSRPAVQEWIAGLDLNI